MQRKQNETELGRMARRYGMYAHKWRDRGYISCPTCHRPIKQCPYCRHDMLMPKAETKPDFLIALEYVYVEGKGATDRWDFTESISNNQRRVMFEHEGWLFLEMGTGKAPNGRAAYLVPWLNWVAIEDVLLEKDIHSIIWERGPRGKNPTSEELLGQFKLEWDDGDWAIPNDHVFWKYHHYFPRIKEEVDDGSIAATTED